jgi:Domain of unknown function (DUF4286)
MIIYNVTIKAETAIADRWLQWMKEEHIPDVINTGCFSSATILRLIEVDDTDGPTYAIQYKAESKADYNRYIQLHADAMRKKVTDKWGNQLVAFRSVLELVH